MQVFSFQNSTIYIFLMKAIYFHIQKKGRKWKENRKLIFQRREPHKNIHTRIDRLINSLACISISYSKFSSDVSFRANKSHFPFLLSPSDRDIDAQLRIRVSGLGEIKQERTPGRSSFENPPLLSPFQRGHLRCT